MSIFPARKAPDNLPRPVHWAAHAVCKDPSHNPETWFPLPTDTLAVEHAKLLCRGCPVQMRCRTDALNRGEEHGVWGGLDEDELRAVRTVRRKAAAEQAAKEKQAAGELAAAG
ncbi:WhiB family transcriptional regulator [Streptomyces sp. KAU_LT]|uniref:WhiB family transcriptional regulator n=1 Tax=Streptomyces sp. KAU_LT TaxID=3046669 RepID=UPI0024B7C611|nr:WhiB family transcriptional regulator [Streptomyces sp. KAU_LT]MDI9836217.1 WhiB family transcriptional regulator [Streptomyces sp. KAU_LT]